MEFCREQVEEDCEELLKRFKETESVRFEVFKNIWRETKFSQIFSGTTEIESRVFTRLILKTACRFFLPPFSFQIRVGGLYLLYSLYHCQTASPSEQIRIALKDWEYVKKFEKDAVDAQHFDVIYILHQLVFHKAFYYTAMPSVLTFRRKRKVKRFTLCKDFIERMSRPQELVNMELLEELSNIHERYEKMKASVCSPSEQAFSSVNLIRKNIIPQLRNTVVDFYTWQYEPEDEEEEEEEDSGEATSSQRECSDRATLLASIKSKAFGHATEACKSRRHRPVKLGAQSNEAGASHPSHYSRAVKPSLKARTLMTAHLSGDQRREESKFTLMNSLTTLPAEERARLLKTEKWN
ncbi:snRNA-activating protein complex subunit 1b [Brachionichthys hirsutus]|uniref:snRNA-activating protein complex subunit 1b n=1 Tax=Brachionichthys hirsutus TaxID=412623 RepID=UPI0036043AC2